MAAGLYDPSTPTSTECVADTRLAHALEDIGPDLSRIIEQEHAVMDQRHFPRQRKPVRPATCFHSSAGMAIRQTCPVIESTNGWPFWSLRVTVSSGGCALGVTSTSP
jgi:hypothetical protein